MNKWIYNKEVMIDYLQLFQNKLEENYGKGNANEFLELLKDFSILIDIEFEPKIKKQIEKIKVKVEKELEKMQDSESFVEQITDEKRSLTKKIKQIDETLNNKNLLEEEYERRNELLPLDEKIFSMRILSNLMVKERKECLRKIDKLNELLKPRKYVEYKKKLEEKERYLKLLDLEDISLNIKKMKLKLQKIFLKCFEEKIEKCDSKSKLMDLIYEFRYYMFIPYDYEKSIYETRELQKEIIATGKKLLEKSHKLKVIERFSKQEDIDYTLLKYIFQTRSINIEEVEIKLIREKDKYFIQVFDGNGTGEKIEMKNPENVNKKELAIRFNKKVKAFY